MDRQAERQELITSIRLSPIAAILTDARAGDNPIVAVNRAFEALTGYGETELIGRNCRILAGPDTEPSSSAALREAIAAARPCVAELLNYRKDGSTFRNAVMIAPVLGDDGTAAFFVGSQMEVVRPDDAAAAAGQQAAARIAGLTPRQREVLRLMARGLRSRQIGTELGMTEKTVKMHRSALMRRLGVASSTEALRLAIEAGF